MAVRVDFNDRIGYYTQVSQDGTQKWKIWFCRANCLVSEIHFHKDENGEEMADLAGFYMDLEHLKRCAKSGFLTNYGKYDKGITLYAKKMDNDLWKMARIFAEQGIKVTIR